MPSTIYKYEVYPYRSTIQVPFHAQPIHVAIQDTSIFVWILMDTSLPLCEELSFQFIGTGHPAPPNMSYFASCGTPDNSFMWHVFQGVRQAIPGIASPLQRVEDSPPAT